MQVHIGLEQSPVFQYQGPLYEIVQDKRVVATVLEALQVQHVLALDSQDKRRLEQGLDKGSLGCLRRSLQRVELAPVSGPTKLLQEARQARKQPEAGGFVRQTDAETHARTYTHGDRQTDRQTD